jgi:hypothetical protein
VIYVMMAAVLLVRPRGLFGEEGMLLMDRPATLIARAISYGYCC